MSSLSDIADEIESSVVDAINGDGCEPTSSPVQASPVTNSGLAEELGVVEQSSDICDGIPDTDGFTNGDEECVG